MANSETERQAFQTALDAALREREELDVLIRHLARRAGVDVPERSAPGSQDSIGPTPGPTADPSSLVADGEFYGQSATKATKALMAKLGRTRPLKTTEIFEAIKKGGVGISNIEVLYKSLQRSDDFLRVAKGTWGLAEWYPERVRKNARKEALEDEDENGSVTESDSGREEESES